jgi:putative flippase GtrA
MRRKSVLQIIRFIATGLVNSGFGYLCYSILVLSDSPRWLAVVGSTAMGILFNFFSYGTAVFGDTSISILPRFVGFYFLLGLINLFLLKILDVLKLGPFVSQALLLPILALLAYFGMRSFVFPHVARKAS